MKSNTYSKSEALSRVNSREDKYNNKQDRTSLKEYNWAAGWIETSVGWYSVQDGELIHAQDSEQVMEEVFNAPYPCEINGCDKCDGTGHDIFMEDDGIICPKCNGTGEEK